MNKELAKKTYKNLVWQTANFFDFKDLQIFS